MPRVLNPELLDTATAEEAVRNLRDLAWINRWLGGNWVLARRLAKYLRRKPDALVLDAGAANGATVKWLQSRFPSARFVTLDASLQLLRQGAGARVAADVERWPIAPRSVDIVICSLFLHHLEDGAVCRALENFERSARMAVVAVDLQRHPVARGFLPATRWLLGWNRITLHDGPVSVDAAFTASELRRLVPRATVRTHFPWFRLSLEIDLQEAGHVQHTVA
ncbi:MAG: class I SAM-dependent methyltransferase [Acidobacteria bacterium]|nr:class I SAM-dependent methyltransferase [Acidobacteriota bacterium]